MIHVLLLTAFSLVMGSVFSQKSPMPYVLPGHDGVVLSDRRISILTDRYNRTHEIRGYRVQIESSSKKEEAKKAKSRFVSRYPGYNAHEIYQQPFFIIKVGDFLTRIEAEKLHRELADEFPGSFVLPDVVKPEKQYGKKN